MKGFDFSKCSSGIHLNYNTSVFSANTCGLKTPLLPAFFQHVQGKLHIKMSVSVLRKDS